MQCIQFADDAMLYLGHLNPERLKRMVEDDLGVLQDWFRANKLTLNVEKSVCLIFNDTNCKNLDMRLALSEKTITIQKETKFLGVWLDKDLKWDRQITETINGVKLRICLLKHGVNFLTRYAKKVLYFAQIHCILSYAIGAWGNMINLTQQKKLQRTQNQCIRLIDKGQQVSEI